MKPQNKITALLLAALLTPSLIFSFSAEAAGHFSKQIKIGSTSLKLNGKGMREATIFKVDVYEAALYLEKTSKNAKAILANHNAPWRLKMHFVRDVKKAKLNEGWSAGFKNNAGHKAKAGQKQFMNWMSNIKEGQNMTFTYIPQKGTEIRVAGKLKGTIAGADFANALLSIWLGSKPPNAGLKNGLLGK